MITAPVIDFARFGIESMIPRCGENYSDRRHRVADRISYHNPRRIRWWGGVVIHLSPARYPDPPHLFFGTP
jgi:hypothetical protein